MCATCGCGESDGSVITIETHTHDGHTHTHHHVHEHEHDHPHETLTLEQKVLAKNDAIAEQNRRWFADHAITVLNLTSSPGSGKTTLLERTIRELSGRRSVSVIEGDQETTLDADRIHSAGANVVQVNTGAGCHLDASMIERALAKLQPADSSVLFIENVGNLVCPAMFDLGEMGKVVVISVTEGTDKPLKYPHMFAAATLVLVNKIDLLPYVDFDLESCSQYARLVNRDVTVLPVSAKTGEGLDAWFTWVEMNCRASIDSD
ncbi:MAG: hydrogenase nickel incorporation protein HypB [Nocardiaceae bacterium]|nr:hydrogenase nickel incorporation protein HypB [Nocardiaceae bacterium]